MGGYRDAKRGDGFVFSNGSSHSPQPGAAGAAARTTAACTPTSTAAGTTAGIVYLEHN